MGTDKQVSDTGPGFGRTAVRLSKESALPFLGASLYATWDTFETQGSFQVGPFIKVFGPSFFLLMWFVGQFLRVRKQLHDRDLLTGINADVREIRKALDKQVSAQGGATPASPDAIPIPDPVAAEMIEQAEAALSAGLSLPALLMAAAAFEHSIRATARQFGVQEGPRVPVRRMLSELEQMLPPGVSGELHALWDARNRIVHSRDAQVSWSANAQQLFNSFRWAVALLAQA